MSFLHAGRLTLALLAGLAGAPAAAADIAERSGRTVSPGRHHSADRHDGDVAGPCGTPTQIVRQPYREQICYGGAHGYAACRWVDREYVVRIPQECPHDDAIDEAWPLPQRPAHGARGLAAKG